MSAIYRFFGSILQFLDKITGNYMIALALFALIIQILMLPLACLLYTSLFAFP